MATCTEPSATILDDGDFYVELNCNDSSAAAAGFLQRRCYVGVTTPGGYECIGSFERDVLGRWRASIDAVYDEQTGSDKGGVSAHRMRIKRTPHCGYSVSGPPR